MADFVRDDVGAGEIARSAETLRKLPEELEIEIDLPVRRTIERTHSRACKTASRGDLSLEQGELGRLVTRTHLLEGLAPEVLGVAQHRAHEILLHVAGGRRLGASGLRRSLLRLDLRRRAAVSAQKRQHVEWVLAEQKADD